MNNKVVYTLLFYLGALNTETEIEERQRGAWGEDSERNRNNEQREGRGGEDVDES